MTKKQMKEGDGKMTNGEIENRIQKE